MAREETRCRHMGYSFRLAARDHLYALSHRQDNTYRGLCYTSRGVLARTRNGSMGAPWMIDPTTHRTMSERSYHGATSRSCTVVRDFRKEGNVIVNDALNTFSLRLYGIGHMVRDFSCCEYMTGARCSSVVRAFDYGAMGRQIDPSWGGPIELFLVPASAPRLV